MCGTDDLALRILVRCLPTAMKEHIQLQVNDKHTYGGIKAFVQTYEMTKSTRNTAKAHGELGVVNSYTSWWCNAYGS